MNAEQKDTKKRKRFLLTALFLAVVVGVGLVFWNRVQADGFFQATATQTAGSEYKTTTVRRGDLAQTVSGTGTVISALSVDLRFPVSGTLSELKVQPGDKVTQGQVLATLSDSASLKQTILDQTLAVQKAQKTLDDLVSGGPGTLAQALAGQASTQQAYAEAKANAHQKGDARCASAKTQEFYYQYLKAQQAAQEWEDALNDPNTGYGHDYILQRLKPLRAAREQAYANYTYCQAYTDQEIQVSQANLQLAKAKMDQAARVYADLKVSAGVDPSAVEIAQATLENARLQLARAQTDLAGATITAPMNATVMAVNAKVGDEVNTSTLITLSDLEQPQVQVHIDETDLTSFAAGCGAEVTFDSLPGETFPGVVTQVSPVLVSVNNANMVEGLIDLQKKEMASGKPLSVGLTAAVEVTCKQAKDALVVPAQALVEPKDQPAYVYVLNSAGQAEKREVKVGLKTVATAEITSGLSEGEKIITSQIGEK